MPKAAAFLKKSGAKNFFESGAWAGCRQRPLRSVIDVFWFAGGQPFFQKRTACLIF
jgi:hypothetical protein